MTLKQGSAHGDAIGDIDSIPWLLAWEHGSAQVQPLGAMLGPVRLRLDGARALEVMHVAPWADSPEAAGLPGVMRRLRGEWPCLPFGRVDYPRGLPDGWTSKAPEDRWNHGYSSNHPWHCIESSGTHLHLAIDYPEDSPIRRMERVIKADPHAPALDISLTVWARRAARLPAGLHPTFRLPSVPGRVQVVLGEHMGIYSYPTNGDAGLSRLHPDTRSDTLAHMAGTHGAIDFTRLPLAGPTEDLVQVRGLRGAGTGKAAGAPFALHYLDDEACVGLWWDTAQLPDLMLWLSNGGRAHFPWMSRHIAIGAEPVNSLFDLGRVATAPADHPLADRLGVSLTPDAPWRTHYRIAAWPQPSPAPA